MFTLSTGIWKDRRLATILGLYYFHFLRAFEAELHNGKHVDAAMSAILAGGNSINWQAKPLGKSVPTFYLTSPPGRY